MNPVPDMTSKPWFRQKRFGYGSGLPCAWQGWVLLIAHMLLILAVVRYTVAAPQWQFLLLVSLAALLPLPIYRAKTKGGWRWRWK